MLGVHFDLLGYYLRLVHLPATLSITEACASRKMQENHCIRFRHALSQLVYSFGTINLSALESGALVALSLTSVRSRSTFLKPEQVLGEWNSLHAPTVVLRSQRSPEDRWCFDGFRGQLGIILKEEASVNYTAFQLTSRHPATSPRQVTIFGFVQSHQVDLVPRCKVATPEELCRGPLRVDEAIPQDDYRWVVLSELEIDPFGVNPLITPIKPQISRANLVFQIVVVAVWYNWGGETTCIHSVQFLGENTPYRGSRFE